MTKVGIFLSCCNDKEYVVVQNEWKEMKPTTLLFGKDIPSVYITTVN